jgi:hypothetical protein
MQMITRIQFLHLLRTLKPVNCKILRHANNQIQKTGASVNLYSNKSLPASDLERSEDWDPVDPMARSSVAGVANEGLRRSAAIIYCCYLVLRLL